MHQKVCWAALLTSSDGERAGERICRMRRKDTDRDGKQEGGSRHEAKHDEHGVEHWDFDHGHMTPLNLGKGSVWWSLLPPPPPLWFWGNEGFGERESVQRGNTSPDPPALFDCNEVAESSAQIKRQASLELYDFFFFKCHDTSASHIDTVNIKVFFFFSSSDCSEWWNKWGAAKKRILKQCHRCINVFQDRAWELKRENNS